MFKKTHVIRKAVPAGIGLMLSATFALSTLAGCQAPMAPTANTQLASGQKQQAAAQTSQTTAQAMAEEREMTYYGYMADADGQPVRYNVFSVDQPAPEDGEMAITSEAVATAELEDDDDDDRDEDHAGKGGKQKGKDKKDAFKGQLKEALKAMRNQHENKMKNKAKGRLDKMKDEAKAIEQAAKRAPWVKNADGTETKSMSFKVEKTVNGQVSSRSVEMTRTRRSDDKTLVSAHTAMSFSQNGVSRSMVRDQQLQEDGSYAVTFHSEMTFKDGSKRVADWNKSIAADGTVTGTGTIAWTGKVTKTVTITIGGTEEAETATAADPATGTQTEVTTTPEGNATAEVTDPATGTSTEVAVDANVDAIAPSDATASPSPDASESPAASPSPEASASPEAAASPAA
jgi:hypothetical protein